MNRQGPTTMTMTRWMRCHIRHVVVIVANEQCGHNGRDSRATWQTSDQARKHMMAATDKRLRLNGHGRGERTPSRFFRNSSTLYYVTVRLLFVSSHKYYVPTHASFQMQAQSCSAFPMHPHSSATSVYGQRRTFANASTPFSTGVCTLPQECRVGKL